MELAYPTNTSWSQFKTSWKKITFGGICYLLRHPIAAPKVVMARLQFALQKKNLCHAIKTPNHFHICNNSEQLVYAATFIERSLAHGPMLRELKDTPNPTIIDIGANCGFVTKWLHTYNPSLTSHAVEVLAHKIARAMEMDVEILQATGKRPQVNYHHKAGWNKTGEELTIFIADRVSSVLEGKIRDTVIVKTMTVDDIPTLPKSGPIFLLKIDTDGSNIQVLEGAKETLKRVKWLLIEEDPDVREWCIENLKDWTMTRLTHCDLIFRSPEQVWQNRFGAWSK